MCDMNSLQRSENYGTTIFNRKQCQIIISNYGLFFIFLAKLAILNSLDIGVILTGYLLSQLSYWIVKQYLALFLKFSYICEIFHLIKYLTG